MTRARRLPPENAPMSIPWQTTASRRDLGQTKAPLVPVALMLIAAFVLSACIQSKSPLLAGSKPLLGAQFRLNLLHSDAEGDHDRHHRITLDGQLSWPIDEPASGGVDC